MTRSKTKPAAANPEAEWFGDRQIDPTEKTGLVRSVFDKVARRYDVMNDVMSLGVHRLWKDHFVRKVAPRDGYDILDVAGGTGDIAIRMAKQAPKAAITVCDLNPAMMQVGRDRAIDQGVLALKWVTGNAETLPFEDDRFQRYTIAFGLRNVSRIDTALAEAYRVLAYGGRFYCLEFSKVLIPGIDKLYDLYSRAVIPRMGGLIAQDRDSYAYLVESIRRFPSQDELAARMEAAGFSKVSVENLHGGVAAIHSGAKL